MNRKVWMLIGLICLGFGAIIAILTTKLLSERPERELVKAALISNSAIIERFGPVFTIAFDPEGEAVEYSRDGTEGDYRFKITGKTGVHTIEVHWRNENSSRGLHVVSIKLLRSGDNPVILQATQP
jgi:hypothetical protein